MATYKVIQDVEAEDKLVGPLTLRQFIYAGIAALCLYLSFLSITKGFAFLIVFFLPVAGFCGFFAFPWSRDQPTEIWALAKIRFFLKPRRRIWDQSGMKELVTVTAPKRIERALTNGLNADEVQSRLNALANTIDSRGWAIKNVNISTPAVALPYDDSDRLVQASSLPQEVASIDVRAADDMLDETANPIAQHFDSMINASSAAHRQQIVAQLQQSNPLNQASAHRDNKARFPAPAAKHRPDYWFLNQPAAPAPGPGQATFTNDPVVTPGSQDEPAQLPHAAMPTAEEEALVAKFRAENSSQSVAYGHMKTLKTPEQLAAEARAQIAAQPPAKPAVTPDAQAAIMNLANNDDLDVATIARQAHKQVETNDDGEVVISLR